MKPIAAIAAAMLAGCQPGPVDETVANVATEGHVTPDNANVGAPGELETTPPRIAKNFHGLWAENDAACGQLTHASRLTITANSVRYPAFVLAVESATQPTENAFAVKGFSKQTKKPAEAHFSIDETGNLLTDEAGGGTVRVRCT